MPCKQQYHGQGILGDIELPLSRRLLWRHSDNVVVVRAVHQEFLLPREPGQPHPCLRRLNLLRRWIEFSIPVRLSLQLGAVAGPQLHVQQRDLLSPQWLSSTCQLAMRRVRRRQILPVWQQHSMPCHLLLPRIVRRPCRLSAWLLLRCGFLRSHKLHRRQLLHQRRLCTMPNPVLLPQWLFDTLSVPRRLVLRRVVHGPQTMPSRKFLQERDIDPMPCRDLLCSRQRCTHPLPCWDILWRRCKRLHPVSRWQLLHQRNHEPMSRTLLLHSRGIKPYSLPLWFFLRGPVIRACHLPKWQLLRRRNRHRVRKAVLLPQRHLGAHGMSRRLVV